MTLTDWLRKNTHELINPLAEFCASHAVTADQVTLIGLAGNLIAALFIFNGKFIVAGIITLFTIPLDVLDGAVARFEKKNTRLGALLDSVCDRYSEMALLLGLVFYYLNNLNRLGVTVSVIALLGSFLVSYIRARAEGLGVTVKQGIMTRVERSIVLIFALIIRKPLIGVSVIAILANATAVQRLLVARKMLLKDEIGERDD